MSTMDKKQQEELNKKINAAIDQADAASPTDGRIGSLTMANALLIKLLVEDMFMQLTSTKKRELLGSLNEILCYISTAADKLAGLSVLPGGEE